ncbi:MAG: DUF4783 domain-containing protein [Bacteroidales bacterium]|nr:DUF4783 domain-containing protein [Bacteroidales bacterium]
MRIFKLSVKKSHFKNMTLLILPLIFTAFLSAGKQTADLPQGIVNALKTGNSETLSQYFNTSMELAMPSAQDDIYSSQQSKLIVRDFFTKHVPIDFTVLHKGGPAESQYAIGSLSTKSGTFRVTLLIKLKDEKPLIHQLRFEQENAD